jgi:site-specific DNA recombinase
MARSTAPARKKRCYLYTRVSTQMQVDGYSLDAQRDQLLRAAEYEGMTVAAEFSDEGKSGKNTTGRPAFQEMMDRIQNGNPDGVTYVLVFKLSRFGRNAADVMNSLQAMVDSGVNLLAVEDKIDSSGPAGKLMIAVLAAVAEIERENIRAQTMAGRLQKAREGKWNGGYAPYGYKLENGMLFVNEDEAPVVRKIFELYTQTDHGCGGIAKWLNEAGYKKIVRQRGTVGRFSEAIVKNIIDNPVYYGKIAYGRVKSEKVEGKRNEYHRIKQDEYDLYDGLHEPIVSEATWMKACLKRQQRGVNHEKVYSLEHEHLLSTILKCPVCGSGMYGSVNRKYRKDGTHRDTFYYLCKHRKNIDGHVCTYRPHPPQARIDAEVEALVVDALQSPAFIKAAQDNLNQTIDADEIKARIAEMEKARAQLAGAKDKLARQMDLLDIADKHYDAKYADMQARLDKFYDQIAETDANIRKERGSLTKLFQGQATMDNAIRMLRLVQDEFGSMPDAVKKRVFTAILDAVEIFEQPQPDGRQVKCVRFKFPVTVDGETDTDWWYTPDDGDDEDGGPGGGPGNPGAGGQNSGSGTGGKGSYKEKSVFSASGFSSSL